MSELLAAVVSWRTLLLVVLVFGFAPGFCLRLLVKLYPKDDPRRRELVAGLYTLGHFERLLYVGEQLETVLFEGVPHRMRAIRVKLARKNNPTFVPRQPRYTQDVAMLLMTVIFTPASAASGILKDTSAVSIVASILVVLAGVLVAFVSIRNLRQTKRDRVKWKLFWQSLDRTDKHM